MNDNHRTTNSIDRIAEELSCWPGSGALIIDHMARWPGAEASERDATEVQTTLLRDTLAPIAERHSADDLSVAAIVLADAVETLAGEISSGLLPREHGGEHGRHVVARVRDPSVLEEEG